MKALRVNCKGRGLRFFLSKEKGGKKIAFQQLMLKGDVKGGGGESVDPYGKQGGGGSYLQFFLNIQKDYQWGTPGLQVNKSKRGRKTGGLEKRVGVTGNWKAGTPGN